MDAEKALEGRCEAIFVLLCCISAEACDAFGRAVGRVVGGAERHGRGPCLQRRPLSGKCCPSQIRRQVLVKVTDRSEATICQIPKGRRASGPSTRCFLVQAEGRHISECVTRPVLPPIVGDEVRRNPNGLRPSPLASAPTAARGIAFTAAAADAEAPRFRTVAVPNSPGTCRLSSKRRGNLEVPSFLGFAGCTDPGRCYHGSPPWSGGDIASPSPSAEPRRLALSGGVRGLHTRSNFSAPTWTSRFWSSAPSPTFPRLRFRAEWLSRPSLASLGEGMVDRVLVSAHAQGLEVVIVLNKAPRTLSSTAS